MIPVRIRNKNLPETVARHQLHNLLHPSRVQLVENIIQQHQWRRPASRPFQKLKLRQLQRNQERLVLPLRTLPLDREIPQLHHQIILMHPLRRIPQNPVLLPRLPQQPQQVALLQMTLIRQTHPLPVLRDIRIIRLKHRNKLIDKLLALTEHLLPFGRHHLLPHIHQFLLRFHVRLEQRIPLHQRLVIPDQRLQILPVELRDHHIHKPPSLLTAPRNQPRVRRRHHHQRNQSDMVRQPRILLPVALELLLLSPLQSAVHLLRFPRIRLIKPLHHEELLPMQDILRVHRVHRTLAERQIIHRIQQIRLSHSVFADHTVQFRRKLQFRLRQILIIQYGYPFQPHDKSIQFKKVKQKYK